jgi:hypothetical protein
VVFAWRCSAIRHVGCAPLFLADLYSSQLTSRSESILRRALFEDTGGMYPELITRPDIKVFLPPIGGLTVYICVWLS